MMNQPGDNAVDMMTPPPLPGSEPVVVENPLAALLKAPAQLAGIMARNEGLFRTGLLFMLCALVFHAVFGFAIGLFSGWGIGLMAAVKAPMIAFFALLLCFPSLYVFSSVNGVPLTLSQTFMLGSSCLAMIGLLLIGLAPVAWLFAVSTESLPFMVLLVTAIWFVSLSFSIRFVNKLKTGTLIRRTGGIGVWFVILALVTLQMTTCLRPLLGKPDPARGWFTSEKKFFLSHYGSTLDEPASPAKSGPKR